jgi:hypothetical protein
MCACTCVGGVSATGRRSKRRRWLDSRARWRCRGRTRRPVTAAATQTRNCVGRKGRYSPQGKPSPQSHSPARHSAGMLVQQGATSRWPAQRSCRAGTTQRRPARSDSFLVHPPRAPGQSFDDLRGDRRKPWPAGQPAPAPAASACTSWGGRRPNLAPVAPIKSNQPSPAGAPQDLSCGCSCTARQLMVDSDMFHAGSQTGTTPKKVVAFPDRRCALAAQSEA